MNRYNYNKLYFDNYDDYQKVGMSDEEVCCFESENIFIELRRIIYTFNSFPKQTDYQCIIQLDESKLTKFIISDSHIGSRKRYYQGDTDEEDWLSLQYGYDHEDDEDEEDYLENSGMKFSNDEDGDYYTKEVFDPIEDAEYFEIVKDVKLTFYGIFSIEDELKSRKEIEQFLEDVKNPENQYGRDWEDYKPSLKKEGNFYSVTKAIDHLECRDILKLKQSLVTAIQYINKELLDKIMRMEPHEEAGMVQQFFKAFLEEHNLTFKNCEKQAIREEKEAEDRIKDLRAKYGI